MTTRQYLVAAQRWGAETRRRMGACIRRELGSIQPADVAASAQTAAHFAGKVLDARETKQARICPMCGGAKPAGQSCLCVDNNCQ